MENATDVYSDLLEESQTAILDYIYMEHHSKLHPFHNDFIDKSQRHGQLQNISQYEQQILLPSDERLISAKEQVTYQHNPRSMADGCHAEDRNSIEKNLKESVGSVICVICPDFDRSESFSNGGPPFQEQKSHPETFISAICNKTISKKSNLAIHMRIHSGDRPYVCEICNTSFTQKGSLVTHARRHTGERPFACTECRASFNDKTAFKNHKRIHTGERPFVCEECGDSFRRRQHLVRHERIHTGEKPYSCKKCRKSFSVKYSMQSHERRCRNVQ